MKLSQAILLGDSLKDPEPSYFLDAVTCRGCAIGGALLAQGLTLKEWFRRPTVDTIKMYWPWLTDEQRAHIGVMYCEVVDGNSSLEQLVDYVRSIEPAEEPAELPGEPYWSDSDTTREMQNSIKGR